MRTLWIHVFLLLGMTHSLAAYTEISGHLGSSTLSAGTWLVSSDSWVNDNTSLTLQDGAVLKFADGVLLEVFGSLVAFGSDSVGVSLTSMHDDSVGEVIAGSSGVPAPGNWAGIATDGSGTQEGRIDFRYAGLAWAGGTAATQNAGVYCLNPNTVDLLHSEIRDCAGTGLLTDAGTIELVESFFSDNAEHGLQCLGGSTEVRGCQFDNNGSYGGRLDDVTLNNTLGNTGSGNGINGLGIHGSMSTGDSLGTPGAQFPLVLTDTLRANDNIGFHVVQGSTLKGAPGGLLWIYGTLFAYGTADDPIVFTSLADDAVGGDTNGDGAASSAQPGDWSGLRFDGVGTSEGRGLLSHLRVAYAGGVDHGGLHAQNTAVLELENCRVDHAFAHGLQAESCELDLDSCTFDANAGDGLFVDSATPHVNNCHFEDNGAYGGRLLDCNLQDMSGNAGSGNLYNGLAVDGTVNGSRTFGPGAGEFPYILNGQLLVPDNRLLTLEAGCLFKSESAGELFVYGALVSNGVSGNPVRFTSLRDDSWGGDSKPGDATPAAGGDWIGVAADGIGTSEGTLDLAHTWFRYGGSAGGSTGSVYSTISLLAQIDSCRFDRALQDGFANLNSDPVFQGCVFEDNGDRGLYSNQGAPELYDNTFSGNTGYGALLENADFTDYSGNSGSGNGVNGLAIQGSAQANRIWSTESAFPLILTGEAIVADNRVLELSPGTLIKGEDGSQLLVYGRLNCNADEMNPVRLCSWREDAFGGDTYSDGPSTGMPGDWLGIRAYGIGVNEGTVDLASLHLYHGGGSGGLVGGIELEGSDQAFLTDCRAVACSASGLRCVPASPEIRGGRYEYNLEHGLLATGTSQPDLRQAHFANNSQYGVLFDDCRISTNLGNTGSGNGVNGFGLRGSTIFLDSLSSGSGFPFVLAGEVIVPDNRQLTLLPGTTFKSQPGMSLTIDGTLLAIGEGAQRITFTSIADDSVDGDSNSDGPGSGQPGDWKGLVIDGGGTNEGAATLRNCRISYGGDGQAGLDVLAAAAVEVTASLVDNHQGHGIEVSASSLSLTGSVVSDNGGDGIRFNSGSLAMGACDGAAGGNCISDNGGFALYNDTADPLEACGNYWGAFDAAGVDALIYDDEEDAAKGAVDFSPWNATSCAPVIFEILVADGQVQLTWTPVAGASSYIVYSSTMPWGGYSVDLDGALDGNSWSESTPGVNTYYKVEAVLE